MIHQPGSQLPEARCPCVAVFEYRVILTAKGSYTVQLCDRSRIILASDSVVDSVLSRQTYYPCGRHIPNLQSRRTLATMSTTRPIVIEQRDQCGEVVITSEQPNHTGRHGHGLRSVTFSRLQDVKCQAQGGISHR